MKANPMQTAPRDGRKITILISDGLQPCRWDNDKQQWFNNMLCVVPSTECLGWVEDIEPPEQSICIDGVIFKMEPNGNLSINDFMFLPYEAQRVREFLNNNE